MKTRFLLPVTALFAISAAGAFAQPAGGTGPQHTLDTQQMNERFQHMNTMMGQAGSERGPQLMALMQQHMQLMQEQMQAMHSTMGGGMMGGMAGGRMGANGMMGGNGTAGGNADMLGRMQSRMDVMQQMMEQMLDQQKLMMQSRPK
jgi:hypothetical protein